MVFRIFWGVKMVRRQISAWKAKAILAALMDADGEHAELFTDSEFWINVITKWAPGWEAKGWKKKGGEIKNLDIVREVYPLYQKSHAYLDVGART